MCPIEREKAAGRALPPRPGGPHCTRLRKRGGSTALPFSQVPNSPESCGIAVGAAPRARGRPSLAGAVSGVRTGSEPQGARRSIGRGQAASCALSRSQSGACRHGPVERDSRGRICADPRGQRADMIHRHSIDAGDGFPPSGGVRPQIASIRASRSARADGFRAPSACPPSSEPAPDPLPSGQDHQPSAAVRAPPARSISRTWSSPVPA